MLTSARQPEVSNAHANLLEAFVARVHLSGYRVHGMIHLPTAQKGVQVASTADVLNQENRPILGVSGPIIYDARAHGEAAPPVGVVQSIGLRKDEVSWLVGGRPGTPAYGTSRKRDVALLFPGQMLVGCLEGPTHLGFSEYLISAKPFQTLLEAEVYDLEGVALSTARPRERLPFVTVNLLKVQAFMDPPKTAADASRLTMM